MVNPYQSPASPPDRAEQTILPRRQLSGAVRHVPVVAVLLIVHGVLAVALGLVIVRALQVRLRGLELEAPASSAGAPVEAAVDDLQPMRIILWVLLGAGWAIVLIGLLQLHAGARNYSFRRRKLGIAALAAGAALTLTCYCAPTALALAVYGLIVYCNRGAAAAFAMGEQGVARHEILAASRDGCRAV